MPSHLAALENFIAADPGGRNVLGLLRPGHLRLAAQSLRHARRVAITSGFHILAAGASETDGPPGAKALGDALAACGVEVVYVTDGSGAPLFEALEARPLHLVEIAADAPDRRARAVRALDALDASHLVAIERAGRSRDGTYRNMRGADISAATSAIDELFLEAADRGIPTVGIGDGGNEIGMGEVLARVIRDVDLGERIACVVPTDLVIVSGVSNWGAYGLVGALSLLEGRDLLPSAAVAAEHVQAAVAAGAVDGPSGRPEALVDGLPLASSIAALEGIRAHVRGGTLRRADPDVDRRRRIVVLGAGVAGMAAARLLRREGHEVAISDAADVALPPDLADLPDNETAGHGRALIERADVIIRSPGVPIDAEPVAWARAAGTPVLGEVEAAWQLREPPIVAVTGSIGRASTADLIASALVADGRDAVRGGNRATPLSDLVAEPGHGDRLHVLTLSSYQLEASVTLRPRAAVILNADAAAAGPAIARHGGLAEYVRNLGRVFMNQRADDALVLPADDPALEPLAAHHRGLTLRISTSRPVARGAWLDGGDAFIAVSGEPRRLGPVADRHPENVLAALAVAAALGVEIDVLIAWLAAPR